MLADAILPYVVDDLLSPHTKESGSMDADTLFSLLAFVVLISRLIGVWPWVKCVKKFGKWKSYVLCVCARSDALIWTNTRCWQLQRHGVRGDGPEGVCGSP